MDESEPSRTSVVWTIVAAVLAAGLAACITILYLGSRTIMDTSGAFVASGGPYAIEHPAPDWAGAIPLSILVGATCVLLHIVAANRANGFKLLGFLWVGVFGSMGWNFLDLGMHSQYYGGTVWVWISCGVMFWLMALPVLVYVIVTMLPKPPELFHAIAVLQRGGRDAPRPTALYTLSHLVAMAVGIYAGVQIFRSVSG